MVTAALPAYIQRPLTLILACLFMLPANAALALDLETVQEAIRLGGVRWVAGETSISGLSDGEKKRLVGLLPEPEITASSSRTLFQSATMASLPIRLDWSDMDGDNYVSPARYQGLCGSCWAFAGIGALESYVMLRTHQPDMEIDLSEQSILSCDSTNGCGGGSGWAVAEILKDTGAPGEACLPYEVDDDPQLCEGRCNDWQTQAWTISSFQQVLGYTGSISEADIIATLKSNLATYGPLWTSMQVYGDFHYYDGDIYEYTSGAYEGGHAVLLIGYDDVSETFKVKNSWGAGWGENGVFHIAYSQVANRIEFGAFTYAYGDPVDLGMEAPMADAGPDITANEGEEIYLDGSASSDPDGQITTYAWRQTEGPDVALSDMDTVQPRFTAPNLSTASDAVLRFELTVTDDDELTATDDVTVTVTWENDSPTARAGADDSVDEGTPVQLDGRSSDDLEGEALSYQWAQLSGPSVSLEDADSARPGFIAPNLTTAAATELLFQLTVTDPHGASDTDRVAITVNWENDAPTATTGSDRPVAEAARVQLDGQASTDPEGEPLNYRWEQISGPVVSIADADTAQASFIAPNLTTAAATALLFQLTVTDPHGASDTDRVAITVNWENDAPTARAGDDQTVEGGDSVTLNADASNDSDDGIAAYLWTQLTGPLVSLSAPEGMQSHFTAPVNDGTDLLQLRFELQVTDLSGISVTDSVDIWITPQPASPGEEPPSPSNPTEPQAPDDEEPPKDTPADETEPEVTPSDGGGGGCFISPLWRTAGTDALRREIRHP